MTPGTEELPTEMGALAGKLTKAQRAAVMRLTGEFSRLGVPRGQGSATATMLRLIPGAVEWRFASDCHRYRLTPMGLALRAHLQANPIPTSDSKEEGR